MGLVIKGQNHWRNVGRPQVPMHRNCLVNDTLNVPGRFCPVKSSQTGGAENARMENARLENAAPYCKVGKRETGKRGTILQGWKTRDWKLRERLFMESQICLLYGLPMRRNCAATSIVAYKNLHRAVAVIGMR